jgi:uncharacterized protein YbaR (Trm112 family)
LHDPDHAAAAALSPQLQLVRRGRFGGSGGKEGLECGAGAAAHLGVGRAQRGDERGELATEVDGDVAGGGVALLGGVARPPFRRRIEGGRVAGEGDREGEKEDQRAHRAPPEHIVYSLKAMPIDPELLEILVCPESHQPVKPANPELLAALNLRIKGGGIKNHQGDAVAKSVDEGLVREDGKCLYLIEDGIPNMLIDERIDL